MSLKENFAMVIVEKEEDANPLKRILSQRINSFSFMHLEEDLALITSIAEKEDDTNPLKRILLNLVVRCKELEHHRHNQMTSKVSSFKLNKKLVEELRIVDPNNYVASKCFF